MTEQFISIITEMRPDLSLGSKKTYASTLNSTYKLLGGVEPINVDLFNDTEKVLAIVRTKELNTQSTILASLAVITRGNKIYKDEASKVKKEREASKMAQEKNPKQEDSWVSNNALKTKFAELKTRADGIYKSKKFDMDNLQLIQAYIIVALTSGLFIPPRRSLDWTELKIKEVDGTKDNYIDGNKFVFNVFKTAKQYGQQSVAIPKELKSILTKWLKINPTAYLLFDKHSNKLTSVKMTQRLNVIFGNNASVNALRHSYCSDMFKEDIPMSDKMRKVASDMATSSSIIRKEYLKKL